MSDDNVLNELMSDPEWFRRTSAAMETHAFPPARRGETTCERCGWVAVARDDGFNLQDVQPCPGQSPVEPPESLVSLRLAEGVLD